MRKNTFPPSPPELLLDVLLVLFERARGSGDLADAVGDLREREVPLATFYRQLQRAHDEGWVEIDEPNADAPRPGAPQKQGRPERLYRLTDRGERVLRTGIDRQRRRVARAAALGLLMEGTP
ncbi:MAG: hypothetical protein AAGD06_22635 [Acidobacteriota bacterium]